MLMVNHELHLMLEEQRRRAHMREAEEHQRAKALRQARGRASLWQRLAARLSASRAENNAPAKPTTACECVVSESI